MEPSLRPGRRKLSGWALRAAGLIVVLCVLGLGLLCRTIFFGPSLKITSSAEGAVIDVRFWSEFPANVRRIRLIEDRTGKILWDLKAIKGKTFPLRTLEIRVGNNPAIPKGVLRRKVAIPDQPTFFVEPDIVYRVEVWTGPERKSNPRESKTFSLKRK